MSFDDLAPIVPDGSSPVMIRRAFERLNGRISRLRALFTGSTLYPVQVASLDIGSLTGLLEGTDGAVGVAEADTDYQQPVTWGDGLQYSAPTASVDLKTSGGLKITAAEIEVDEPNIDHDALQNFLAAEHFVQTAITNVSTGLATGLLTVTTGTGALGSTTDPVVDTLTLKGRDSDPGSPVDGCMWYRSDTDEFRARINGATKILVVAEP